MKHGKNSATRDRTKGKKDTGLVLDINSELICPVKWYTVSLLMLPVALYWKKRLGPSCQDCRLVLRVKRRLFGTTLWGESVGQTAVFPGAVFVAPLPLSV